MTVGTLYRYSDYEFACGMVLELVAFISFVSTGLTIWLIFDMKRRNRYIQTILTLTMCQLVLDMQFFIVPFYYISWVAQLTLILNVSASLCVCLWINYISALLYKIFSTTRRSAEWKWSFPLICSSITAFSIAMGLTSSLLPQRDASAVLNLIVLAVKIASIVFNIAVHWMISLR